MKLVELFKGQEVILQILWGEKEIEFICQVLEHDQEGVYVSAAEYNGKPIDLEINSNSKIVCHLFADDTINEKRVSWKKIEVKTLNRNNRIVYFLKTSIYNSLSNEDDRRRDDRFKISANGRLFNAENGAYVDVEIYDISDVGISFYAPNDYEPNAGKLTVYLSDAIGEQSFALKISCSIVRSKPSDGKTFYGCRILEDNNDYLLYGCLKRLEKKKHDKELAAEDVR